MPTCGRYELGEELSRKGAFVVAAVLDTAMPSGSAGRAVVKFFQSDRGILTPDQIASQTAAFLVSARMQQRVATAGSSQWAPVHDVGAITDGAYYVTTHYRLSAQKLIRGKVRLAAPELFALADGTIKGLLELKRACGRCHGNLKASNILLESAGRSSPICVRLTDPADRADSCSEVGDLQALGGIIYELITGQAPNGYASWPIPASAAWAELGRGAERWRELCNRLLHPGADIGSLTLEGEAYEVGGLSPKPRAGKLIRRAGLAAATAILGTVVIHWIPLRHPAASGGIDVEGQPHRSSTAIAASGVPTVNQLAGAKGDPSTLNVMRQDLAQGDAGAVRQQSIAQKVADLLSTAKVQQRKDEYPECIATLDAVISLSPESREAKTLRAEIIASMATPDYKQKVFKRDVAHLMDSLRPKVDAAAGFTPDLYFALSRVMDASRFDDLKGRELLDHIRSCADGTTPTSAFAEYLNRAFETSEQRADRMARERQAKAAADEKSRAELTAELHQLEVQAVKEAQAGHFDTTDEILAQACSLSHDPEVELMSNWASSFKAELHTFAAERHKQYDELAGKVELLLSRDKPDYAIDLASQAYLISDAKAAFRSKPWVDELLRQSIQRAQQFNQSEEWIKSLRVYSDLATIEPSVPHWKDELKLATRRVRLLALYSPKRLEQLKESEAQDREQVEHLLSPTSQPAAQHHTSSGHVPEEDWTQKLRGVQMDMLLDAMADADHNYYRVFNYKEMAAGGVLGLRAVLTTKGLEEAFPKLADARRAAEFLNALNEVEADNRSAAPGREQEVLRQTLMRLQAVNRETIELPNEVLVSEFTDGAFEKLDPFTNMIWPSGLEEFNKATQGKFSGVGIQVQSGNDGSLRVVSPIEDSPAFKAGIKAGDIISRIDGNDANGISVNQAVRMITGPPHSTVRLTIKGPEAQVKEYTIARETVHVTSVKGYVHLPGGGWDYVVDPQQKIGYIRITNFTADTASELNTAIEAMKLQHIRGIIMDLRYNPGGFLNAATDVADKFLDHGVIVSTRPDRDTGNQPTIVTAKPDADDCALPLIVLVNQYSASASEIVAGALKDDHRATIVGERTFGKGCVQMLFPLSNRAASLRLTTSHFYLPSGRCIHREEESAEWGVDPDVTVEMTPDQMRSAIEARQNLDVLRSASPADIEQLKPDEAKSGSPKEATLLGTDLLARDSQLSAALLLLRLQLTGTHLN